MKALRVASAGCAVEFHRRYWRYLYAFVGTQQQVENEPSVLIG